MDKEIVWVAGQLAEDPSAQEFNPDAWELVGVYTEEELAVDACRTENYFIGPVSLNDTFPPEKTRWVGSYYPKHEMSKEDQLEYYKDQRKVPVLIIEEKN